MYRCSACHRRIVIDAPCPRDGSPPPAGIAADHDETDLPSPPGFALGEPLGAGGFSVVWAARRLADGATVAIKVGRADNPTLHARFLNEADALQRIGPPHVPELYERGRLEDGRPYLAMERLAGATLAAELAAREAPLDPAAACALGEAILVALEAAHGCGVIHRDLKPENIFLSEPSREATGRRATVLDFGLTKRINAPGAVGVTQAGAIVGTPMYMAPEQLRGDRAIDARADLYAFGVVLFELATLRPPFVGDARSIEHGHLALRPPRPSAFAPVDPALEQLILACLAKDPGRRPDSAGSLRRALAEVRRRARDAAPASADRAQDASGAVPPDRRLIAEGRLPVVLLLVEVERTATPVVPIIAERRGFVVRQRGRRYVAVFSGVTTDAPALAALDAARALVERHGARVALHLAPVTLRWKERGAPSVFGAPVDRPDAWMPREPWAGVALTAEIERVLPPPCASPVEVSQVTVRARSLPLDRPLIGRRAEVQAIEASLGAVLADHKPGLFTLIGAPGLGKSRLVEGAAASARALYGEDRVIVLRASHALSPSLGGATVELLGRVRGASGEPPPDPQALCGAQIGVMRAIAEGLRRLAREGPLAVLLDAAHAADDAALDALEYASLIGEGGPLWVLVAAQPQFEQVRPSWGARTERRWRATLGPLDAPASSELAARLLEPAEYPPSAVLQRLAAWSGGNPLCLAELVLALKRAGVVQKRPSAGTFFVATAELDRIPPSPAWQWLAARQIEGLSPELAAFARLCAVLGDGLQRDAIEAVQDALDREGCASAPVDVGYGLASLVDRGFLLPEGGGRHAFQSALVHDALRETLDEAQRAEIHRAALAYYRARVDPASPSAPALAALARHAAASGAAEEAADAYLRLGDLAQARHEHVEADQQYTAALGLSAAGDARRRVRALAGRGKSRCLLFRVGEAEGDLAEARSLALTLGDPELAARVLLEEATALDWQRKLDASAQRVEEAAALLATFDAPHLRGRLLVAQGRTSFRRMGELRQGSAEETIALFEQGIALAAAAGDHDARVIGLLMLPAALALAGRHGEGMAYFDEAIALTTAAGDRVHLCTAFGNRAQFQRSPEQAVEDLKRAIVLSRELGNPWLERSVAHNAAERLHLGGRTAEALPIAQRARLLEERFVEHPLPSCSLLLARILLLLGEWEEARRQVTWVAAACPPQRAPHLRYGFFKMAQIVLFELLPGSPPAGEGWDDVIALTEQDRNLETPERLEMLYWRARLALRGGRRNEAERARARAWPLLEDAPPWGALLEALFTTGSEERAAEG